MTEDAKSGKGMETAGLADKLFGAVRGARGVGAFVDLPMAKDRIPSQLYKTQESQANKEIIPKFYNPSAER